MRSKLSFRQEWREIQPTKTGLFWACMASVVLTMIIGFTLGGWMTEDGAHKEAQVMARNAVIERLAPICVAQFNQDPANILKLNELNGLTSSQQRAQFVQDHGWATISGEETPDRKVADACTKLILEMGP
jgi:hypothetical protein